MHICSYTIVVTKIRFEWDEAKNASNQRKHGLSFEEASSVFLDPLHVAFADRVVDGEQRWLAMGLVKLEGGSFLILAVAHTAREDFESGDFVEIIRIISARRATSKERRLYGDENS